MEFLVVEAVLLTFLTGCVGVLPLPEFSNHPTYGTILRARDIAFIAVGTTSASEVFGALGTNCLCTPRWRAVAFSWELPGGRGLWWVSSMENGIAGEFEWSRWRALFVAFGTNNVVTATATKHLSSSRSLHEQLETWARDHHAGPGHIHPEFFVTEDPESANCPTATQSDSIICLHARAMPGCRLPTKYIRQFQRTEHPAIPFGCQNLQP
ncbi:MAG TPA: hypothetical protein VFE51_11975 [Verrucomicrobiae bacterium]|nr:hypothetical protein [Verrucomicrobiae bacterium]